jgi:hypothetical protein
LKKDRLKEQDVIIGGILTVLSSVIYFLIRFSELHSLSRGEIGLSPAFFPELAFLFFIISSVILLISSLVRRRKQDKTEITQSVNRTQIRQIGIILLLLLVYISLIDVVGYYISSFCTLFTLMLVFKVRGWYKILLISMSVMAVVFLFFEKGLRVLLPRGFLF